MSKKYFVFIIALCIAVLAACSKEKSDDKKDTIEVDKNLTNVEITIPKSFIEDQSFEDIQQEAKEEGIDEVIQNEDSSITYKMSKKVHKKMLKELEENLIDSIEELKNDDEFSSIKDIKYNKSFDEFTFIVDREAYESGFEGFATIAIGMSSTYYQVFKGVKPEDNKVKFSIQDEATGEVFNTITYPDSLKDIGGEETE